MFGQNYGLSDVLNIQVDRYVTKLYVGEEGRESVCERERERERERELWT